MRVAKTISYAESANYKESFGGMGGWFQDGMRWKDYIDSVKDEYKCYAEALREWILENKIKDSAEWHQNSSDGVPVFNDNTCATFSYRAWGDLLAAVWSEAENKDYSYMSFYC